MTIPARLLIGILPWLGSFGPGMESLILAPPKHRQNTFQVYLNDRLICIEHRSRYENGRPVTTEDVKKQLIEQGRDPAIVVIMEKTR